MAYVSFDELFQSAKWQDSSDGTEVVPQGNSMKKNEIIERSRKFAEPYCVTNSKKFRLKDVDPGDTGEATSEDKPRAKELLETGIQALAELQDVLYAQDRWSVLLIFQAMDAAGKDGAIKHVMSGVNPQGCQVYSFKSPSAEDLNHDYLWRCLKCLPERGRIGIFNRSYYEETLVVRVHPELAGKTKNSAAARVGKGSTDRGRQTLKGTMPYEQIMDDQRVNETMRILTYDEPKTGVAAAIGIPVDDGANSQVRT
jgi:polyphosphate kinase 2 (PPK2 family)